MAGLEGGQELSDLERRLLEEREPGGYRRSEVPQRVWDIFENLMFQKIKVSKEKSLEDDVDES